MFFKCFRKIMILLALGSTLACGLFTPSTPQPAATLNALYTAAAETLISMSTQGATTQTGQPSVTSTLSISTSTPVTFETFTLVPPLQTVTLCDAAAFITDVTYPDGSVIGRNTAFTKVWRLKTSALVHGQPPIASYLLMVKNLKDRTPFQFRGM